MRNNNNQFAHYQAIAENIFYQLKLEWELGTKGSGERTKELSVYKKTAEKGTGKKFKELY